MKKGPKPVRLIAEPSPEQVVRRRKRQNAVAVEPKAKRGARPLFEETADSVMSKFLDSLRRPPSEEELQGLLVLLQQHNQKIQMKHINKRVTDYVMAQYKQSLQNKMPMLIKGATLPFRFFDYEKEAMRRIVVANSLARYDDRHFVNVRKEFNRWRMQNGFTLVEQSSMKSWCAYDRKCARDVASNEPFVCPTISMVTRCFRLQCRGFVDELRGARLLHETANQHLHCLAMLAAASDDQLQRIVELFVAEIVSLRLAVMKRSKLSSVQQLCVLRLFEDTLLRNYDHSFRVAFESCLQEQFDVAPPPRSSYEHVIQLFWNAFGTAVHFRRIEHEPESNFDIGASLGDVSGNLGEYVRFSELEMTTLYYLLGVSGSKVFSLFAKSMSDDGSDDYSVVASGIYGNPDIMKQYKYAQKNVANQSHAVWAGTLCWPPVDLFIRCLAIARAVFSPPLSSMEACARLVATVGSKEFIQQCYHLIEEYGQLAFGERMQEASFHDVYSRMMIRLCAHYARLLARVRSQQTARRLVKPSTDVIARSAVALDSAKPLSTKSVLTAVGAARFENNK